LSRKTHHHNTQLSIGFAKCIILYKNYNTTITTRKDSFRWCWYYKICTEL